MRLPRRIVCESIPHFDSQESPQISKNKNKKKNIRSRAVNVLWYRKVGPARRQFSHNLCYASAHDNLCGYEVNFMISFFFFFIFFFARARTIFIWIACSFLACLLYFADRSMKIIASSFYMNANAFAKTLIYSKRPNWAFKPYTHLLMWNPDVAIGGGESECSNGEQQRHVVITYRFEAFFRGVIYNRFMTAFFRLLLLLRPTTRTTL